MAPAQTSLLAKLDTQQRVRDFLTNAVASGRASHAYLFLGAPGAGKLDAAWALAQAFLCEQDGCGSCDSCVRVARHTHPDVHYYTPESATGYLIAQTRELLDDVPLAPIRAKAKVYIIDRAEQLRANTANALLKTLEEPPEGVMFILLGTSADVMLPTIVSRCQCVPFRLVSPTVAAQAVSRATGQDPARCRMAVAVAGSPTRGIEFLKSAERQDARRQMVRAIDSLIAADEAMAQAGVNMDDEDPTRSAVVFGAGIGGIDELQKGFRTLDEKGPKRVNPLFIPTMIGNMAAGHIAIRYGMRGECIDVSTACATGAHNIGSAVRSIRHGYCDLALAGGSEESVNPICIAGFTNLGALTHAEDPQAASMPFDVRRSGFVAGEGGAVLVLESLEHALARGAKPIAEITGFGSTGDAYHMTAPNPTGEGIQRAMQQALDEGGFTVADLGHVNAHGTSTHANDATEAAALIALAGDELGRKIPITSVKGSLGHTLGAAGAVEAVVTALSVANQCVPPTAGFAQPDPECPVNVVSEPLQNYPQKVALSNSLGFGGHNAVLAVSPYSESID